MSRTEDAADEPPSARWALIIAAVVIVVIRTFVPFGGTILYPFTLLATWVHEMGHGLSALLTGGFDSLEIFANASGLAHTRTHGWVSGLVSAGGLLGPPIAGATILAISRGPRSAAIVLWALVFAIAISTVVWVRTLTGWIALPMVALAIGFVALRAGPTTRLIAAHFIAVLFALDTIGGIDYCFTSEAFVGGEIRKSDVANMADALGGHWLLWGIAISLVSLALLALGAWLAWRPPWKRRDRKPA